MLPLTSHVVCREQCCCAANFRQSCAYKGAVLLWEKGMEAPRFA
jgi:hypothetical protein